MSKRELKRKNIQRKQTAHDEPFPVKSKIYITRMFQINEDCMLYVNGEQLKQIRRKNF